MTPESPNIFRPPADWEAVYAAAPNEFTFGEEPSQIARVALTYFRAFSGDPSNAVALDLGCGEGRDTVFLASAGLRVVARDIAPTGLEKLEKLRARLGVPPERIDAALGDARVFEYPVQAYDLALAANIYQFLPPADVPAHIARLQCSVKPGGLCAVGVFSPAMQSWGADLTDRFTATADELLAFFGDGWLLLDRTDYWTYRLPQQALASFVYVVARKTDP